MPAKKTSVYLIQSTLDVAGEGESLSGRLNQIVARYDELMKLLMPKFSGAEWSAIFEANSGYMALTDDMSLNGAFTGAWANVADSRKFDEKWDVDVIDLSTKMRGLEPPQKIAVLEAIQTFWEHVEKPTGKAMKLATRSEK